MAQADPWMKKVLNVVCNVRHSARPCSIRRRRLTVKHQVVRGQVAGLSPLISSWEWLGTVRPTGVRSRRMLTGDSDKRQ